MGTLWGELQRRKVVRVAVVYAIGAWVLLQIGETVLGLADMPAWTGQLLLAAVVVGLPIAIALAWAFEITPGGVRREAQVGSLSSSKQPFAHRESLAVLPFSSSSEDPEQEYFGDGLVQDIITDLSQVPQLLVIARNAAFTFRPGSIDPRQAGKDLGVNLVLQGGVRKSGDRIRVAAQLIDVATGDNIWSKRYDRKFEDVFTVQDDLTKEIVTALEVELVSGEQGRHRRSKYTNPEAGELLYKAMFHFHKYERTANIAAKEMVEQFVEMEPDSILGYVWLANIWSFALILGWQDPRVALENLEKNVRKGLEIDDKDPQVLVGDSILQVMTGNLDHALKSAELAVQVAPSLDDGYRALGWVQMLRGDSTEAIENLKYSVRLCPVTTAVQRGILGTAYRNAGRYAEAIVVLEDCIEEFPEFTSARAILVSTLSLLGKEEQAKQVLEELLRKNPDYSIEQYTTPNFYQEKRMMDRWADSLRKVGMPEHPE